MTQPMIMQCLFSAFHNYCPDQRASYFRGTPRFTTFINSDNRWNFLLARTAEPLHCYSIKLVMFAHYSHACREHIILVVSINLTSLNCYPFFRSSWYFCFLFTRFLFLIHEVSGSNLYPDYGYPDRVWVFCGILQQFQINVRKAR